MNITSIIRSIEDFFTERRLLFTLLGVILIIFIAILIFSDGFSGGTETLNHFRYSKWAFSHPEFFLNHWAKPVYTLLSAPFAILGFKSFQLFNILIGILAGYISYLVAKELKMKSPLLAIAICCFTPIFMINLFSGLPEILFAFTAILTSYLLIKEKYVWGALVVSFLPIIKTEGILLIPIYAYFLIHKKHYREVTLMLTGLILYSFIGFVFGKGLFWLFTEMPKAGISDFYAQGNLFQFAKRSPGYFGIPNEIFFVTGLFAGLSLYIRQKSEYSKEFFLVVLPFLVYFIAHSLSYWSGVGGSLGLSKYMAAIVPFMAVMATRGLYLFAKMFLIIFKLEWVRVAALIAGVASVTHIPFVLQNYPLELDSASYALKSSADWIKSEKLDNSKVYYNHPSLFYFLDINPFDNTRCQQSLNNPKNPSEGLKNGDIFIYDDHYSKISGIGINELINNSEFELLRIFDPKTPLTSKYENRIAIFKKLETDTSVIKRNNIIFNGADRVYKSAFHFDFDNSIFEPEAKYIGSSKINPNKYLRIKKSREYYLSTEFIPDSSSVISPFELLVKMKLFLKTPDEKLKFVIDVYNKNERIVYKGFDINIPTDSNPEEWANIEFKVLLPEITKTEGIKIITYVWNKKKGEYLIDDYRISYRTK